jgi:hypothetical protein
MVTIAKERRPLFVPNDSATAVISSSVDITGSVKVVGSLAVNQGITGSIKEASVNKPFILAGSNITATYNSDGQWVITATGTSSGSSESNGNNGLLTSWIDTITSYINPWAAVSAGGYTTGIVFFPVRANQTCVGIRFLWKENAERTVKATLYKYDGTFVASATAATSTEGIYTATFSTPASLSLTAGGYIVAVYEGSAYIQGVADIVKANGSLMNCFGSNRFQDYIVCGSGMYGHGDAAPYSSHYYLYPIEPMISG